jgi:hypothetical protein
MRRSFRAGIEGTISAYDARTGVKWLRVRGFEAVRFCATLKATAGSNPIVCPVISNKKQHILGGKRWKLQKIL